MESGYLNLITRQIDPVHYLLIDGYYYTLSFKMSNKVTSIMDQENTYINLAYKPTRLNRKGPFKVERPLLSTDEIQQIEHDKSNILVDIEIIADEAEILEFQQLSKKRRFNYFPKITNANDHVLLKYKRRDL